MLILILGILIFIGVHLLPAAPNLRAAWLARLGERNYKIAFSLVAALGLAMMIFGKIGAPFVHLWQPPAWGRAAAMFLMLPAVILFVAAQLPCRMKRALKHPMMLGVLLWGAAHLLANGDLASLLLFGGLGAYAVFSVYSMTQRGQGGGGAALVRHDVIAVFIGGVIYAVLFKWHAALFGAVLLP